MGKKPIIIYDLQDKTQVQKVKILRELYGYQDSSNYIYKYKREGKLKGIKFSRQKKAILKLQNEKDLAKVVEIFKKLKIKFEVGSL